MDKLCEMLNGDERCHAYDGDREYIGLDHNPNQGGAGPSYIHKNGTHVGLDTSLLRPQASPLVSREPIRLLKGTPGGKPSFFPPSIHTFMPCLFALLRLLHWGGM